MQDIEAKRKADANTIIEMHQQRLDAREMLKAYHGNAVSVYVAVGMGFILAVAAVTAVILNS